MTINPLDITTATLGLAYILLEYRASIWMWAVGAVMQLLGIVLYYQKGLYADCGMEFYYLAMTAYGWWRWRTWTRTPSPLPLKGESGHCLTDGEAGRNSDGNIGLDPQKVSASPLEGGAGEGASSITHIPLRLALLWTGIAGGLWFVIWYLLSHYTDSTVPVADAFTTALSLVGIWALAHKYLEQWIVWIAVDVVTCWLYFQKDIPFKASLYALYVVIAIAGFRRWHQQMKVS